MIMIRLQRIGKKKKPFYRIVLIPKRAAAKGRALEILGYYNPLSDPEKIEIKKERIEYWTKKGAKFSNTVTNLLVKIGFLPKSAIIKKTRIKKKKKKKEEKPEKPAHITVPASKQKEEGESLLETEEIEKRIQEEKEEKEEKTEEIEKENQKSEEKQEQIPKNPKNIDK